VAGGRAACVGAFMGQLDASIVTVALPALQRVFQASIGAVTWVGLSYLLVLVATVTAVGRFADMWGRKLLYVYGFVVFTIGSALCGLAPGLGALAGFRVLEAVGAAILQANSVAIIVLAVPGKSRGKAIGIQGAAQAVGLAVGPTAGACSSPRGVAAYPPGERAVRYARHGWRAGAGTAKPSPAGADRLRLDGPGAVRPRWLPCCRLSRSAILQAGRRRSSCSCSWRRRFSGRPSCSG
jgi:MFS family permease